jgi:hypothetical protein
MARALRSQGLSLGVIAGGRGRGRQGAVILPRGEAGGAILESLLGRPLFPGAAAFPAGFLREREAILDGTRLFIGAGRESSAPPIPVASGRKPGLERELGLVASYIFGEKSIGLECFSRLGPDLAALYYLVVLNGLDARLVASAADRGYARALARLGADPELPLRVICLAHGAFPAPTGEEAALRHRSPG